MKKNKCVPFLRYNMSRDRTETNNLASTYPEIVTRLAGDYHRYAEQRKVTPWEVLIEKESVNVDVKAK